MAPCQVRFAPWRNWFRLTLGPSAQVSQELTQRRYRQDVIALCRSPARVPDFKDLALASKRGTWVCVEYRNARPRHCQRSRVDEENLLPFPLHLCNGDAQSAYIRTPDPSRASTWVP